MPAAKTMARQTAEHENLLERRNLHLSAAYALTLRLGAQLDLKSLATELVLAVKEAAGTEFTALLVKDDESETLRFQTANKPDLNKTWETSLFIPLITGDGALDTWLQGESRIVSPDAHKTPNPFTKTATLIGEPFLAVPLLVGDTLHGALLLWGKTTDAPLGGDMQRFLEAIAPAAAIALRNARMHSETVEELADKMNELRILRRIDRELMDTIELEPVFLLTLDWALRFSRAQAATLALYDQELDELYGFVDYGYDMQPEQIDMLRAEYGGGIAQRVARSGHGEIIPDVTLDNAYIPISPNMRSLLAMPVMRNDRVVAVITVESRLINGFTERHVEFVDKLASRAGVAIDNARLYTDTKREREKLSRILSAIADPVIVIGNDDRLALINQSALSVLQLPPEAQYEGRVLAEVFGESDIVNLFYRAKNGRGNIEELKIGDERTFYVNTSLHEGVGWIVVMHDITPLKQTDQLKTELVQTVSHDLKQPLGVMNGYVELLMLQNKLDATGETYAHMILRSITAMRQLIDDLLDLAKIESGVKLELNATPIASIITESIETVRLMANKKDTQIINEVRADLPDVNGDPPRLTQIFNNLIGNAIKYSPPKSIVRVTASITDNVLRVAVRDNGIGIAPEDQARIFDRFYRVRRSETKDIEGTGLGLAIVKKLVEAHGGQIGIDSRLGEGTTFHVSLPVRAG
jgi:signal transduction histidine kinase